MFHKGQTVVAVAREALWYQWTSLDEDKAFGAVPKAAIT